MKLTCSNCSARLTCPNDTFQTARRLLCPRCRSPITVADAGPPEMAVRRSLRSDGNVDGMAAVPAAHVEKDDDAARPAPPAHTRTRKPTIMLVTAVLLVFAVAFAVRSWAPANFSATHPGPAVPRKSTDIVQFSGERTASTPLPIVNTPFRAPAVAVEKPEFDDRWHQADFILGHPEHLAIAVSDIGTRQEGKYRVIAKATGREAMERINTAQDLAVPLILHDNGLARRVYARTETEDDIDAEIAQEVSKWWRIPQYVPEGSTLVAFNDLRHRRRRVGFRTDKTEKGFFFQELDVGISMKEEVPTDFVQPGTLLEDLDDTHLKHTVDILDYCLYHVAKRLTADEQMRRYVAIAVNPVSYKFPSSIAENTTLTEGRLEDEIYEQLLKLEIGTIERRWLESEGDGRASTVKNEQARSKWATSGSKDSRDRPSDAMELSRRDLLGASHLLITELRPPVNRGFYELSMRLVDVATAKILWAGQGDRIDTSEQAIDLASSPYLLDTGRVMAIRFEDTVELAGEESAAALTGGFPLLMPPIRILEHEPRVSTKPRGSTKPRTSTATRLQGLAAFMPQYSLREQLGYIEGNFTEAGDTFEFRGLFDKQAYTLPKSAIAQARVVQSLADVPAPHQMRYLTWRLAKVVVPTAGRVTDVTGTTLRVTLGRSNLVKPGDRLRALRPGNPAGIERGPLETILPVELIATEVHDDEVLAIASGEASGSRISIGDIAHRLQRQKPAVAVLPVKASPSSSSWTVIVGPLLVNRSQQGSSSEDAITVRMANLVESALAQVDVVTVERSTAALSQVVGQQRSSFEGRGKEYKIDPATAAEFGKLSGATHVVLASLAPGLHLQGKHEAPANFRIIDVATGMIVDNIEYTFTFSQMNDWKP